MYGTQAISLLSSILTMFENDVKMYGTQSISLHSYIQTMFENDVKMYGTQADLHLEEIPLGLRMM